MRSTILLSTLLLAACPDLPCAVDSATDTAPSDDDQCCKLPDADQCVTHPFGRAIECGPEERPQTGEKCEVILDLNPGICASEYVACRDALRVAACDECPVECAGIAGACEEPESGRWRLPLPVGDKPPPNPRECLRLDEVMITPSSGEVGGQWIEVRNTCAVPVDARDVYAQYTQPVYDWYGGFVSVWQLGVMAPGACATIGGPASSVDNGAPVYDVVELIDPPIIGGGTDIAEAVGLFVKGDTRPFSAVLYGGANKRDLVDESGQPGAVDAPWPTPGASLRWTGAGWAVGKPQPGACL